MTAEYEEEKEAFSKLNDVASRVRSQGRYVNRLAELTGAVKNGDQCGKFKKNSHSTHSFDVYTYTWDI